ncbi:MAG: tetratricopeptide repeat protein [Proteobacteria bacterium]|nr:tetratricopeptide repeat protein [Pseudomonadota bacterium]
MNLSHSDNHHSLHRELHKKVMLYLSVGRYEVAEKLLNEAIETHESNGVTSEHSQPSDDDSLHNAKMAELHNLAGFVYHRQSKFQEAMASFQRATENDPHHIEARINYALTLCDLGEYHRAKHILAAGKHHTDKHHSQSYLTLRRLAQHHQALGDDYIRCGMEHHSLSEYQKALRLYKNNPSLRLKIAKVLMSIGSHKEAIEHLNKLTLYPQTQEKAHSLLGIIAARQGDEQQCIKHWQKITEPKERLLRGYQSLTKYWQTSPHATHPYNPPSSTSHHQEPSL